MDSLYAEVVVKPKQSTGRKIIVGIATAVILFVIYLACITAHAFHDIYVITFCLPLVISVGALTIYFHKMGKMEFEYIYCDDVIDIAKIKAKQKRKNIARIETDNIELFAPAGAKELESYKKLPKRDFASAKKENPVYVLITVINGTKVRVLLEPSQKMLECLKMKLGTRIIE